MRNIFTHEINDYRLFNMKFLLNDFYTHFYTSICCCCCWLSALLPPILFSLWLNRKMSWMRFWMGGTLNGESALLCWMLSKMGFDMTQSMNSGEVNCDSSTNVCETLLSYRAGLLSDRFLLICPHATVGVEATPVYMLRKWWMDGLCSNKLAETHHSASVCFTRL